MFKKQREREGERERERQTDRGRDKYIGREWLFFLHKPRSDHIIGYMSVHDQPLSQAEPQPGSGLKRLQITRTTEILLQII